MNAKETQDILKDVKVNADWVFDVYSDPRDARIFWLKVGEFGGEYWLFGRKWMLDQHMTKSEIVQTALAAYLAFVEHEARERFLYKDKNIFGPHYDVDVLHSVCGMAGGGEG